MDQMARDFAEQAHFLFVYVREAHPDEFPDHPEHHSIEQKFQHARDMQERHQTPRTVLVDSLDGDVHRLYAGAPNMSWVLDHTGRVAYKAAWTAESEIRPALESALRIRELKSQRRYKDCYTESMSILPSTRDDQGRRQDIATTAAGLQSP